MRFTKVKWKSLFSYGDYYSEVALDQDGIVFVRGVNRDDNTSNGSGKSSIIDVFVWTLYGKPLKTIPADNIINTHIPGCAGHGIVEFWHDGDYYEVNRYREDREYGNGVVVKKNGQMDENFTNGTNRDVQERIDELLGLDFFGLTSSIIFSSEVPFQIPKLTPEKRRQYLEDILGLQAYSEYGKVAKNRVRAARRSMEDLQLEEREKKNFLASEKDDLENYTKRFNNFTTDKKAALDELATQLIKLDADIAAIDLVGRHELETFIEGAKTELDELKQKQSDLKLVIANWDAKHDAIKKEMSTEEKTVTKELGKLVDVYEKQRKTIQKSIDLISKECPTCERGWDPAETHTHITKYNEQLAALEVEHKTEMADAKSEFVKKCAVWNQQILDILSQRSATAKQQNEMNERLTYLNEKVDAAKREVAKMPSQQTLDSLNEKRERLLSDIEKKKAEQNPYKEVIDNLHIKINDTLERMEKIDETKTDLEEKLKYATFWDESFNNDGLKLFIFNQVIPLLNARIGYYLPIMFDGKDVKISFDKMMNMTVLANGKPMSYGGMSQGERKRVDLSISLALLDTAQAQHGVISNVMFFDEIFDSSLDSQGVKTVSDLLRSMPVQTIFIMSHRLEIANEFDNILDVEKKGKYSRILN